MAGTYGSDLAYIHHEGFSEYALDVAPGILRYLNKNGAGKGLVVELGCGSGILARELSNSGFDVLGIDSSESMLRLARQRAPEARLQHASLVSARLPRCAAVLSVGEVLSFAFADESVASLDRLFSRVYKALVPGGIFLLDFATAGRDPGGMPKKGFWAGEDWAVLVEVEPSHSYDLLLTRKLTTFRRVGTCYRRREETHVLQLFHTEDLLNRLRHAGFEARPLKSVGKLRFRSGHRGVFAKKG